MKNIYLIPTDKPSRLFENVDSGLSLNDELEPNGIMCQNQNIYITSSEEIKEGDWCYNSITNKIYRKLRGKFAFAYEYKIILTTDPKLINDGVQAINDEFLEWFVKNSSCDEIEIDKNWNYPLDKSWEYKTIIPKEEPLSYEEFRKIASNDLNNKFDTDCSKYSEDGDSDIFFYANSKYWEAKIKEEQKQHLIDMMKADEELGLYEAAECKSHHSEEDFIRGAKWQQEQDKNNYSKEDMKSFADWCRNGLLNTEYSVDKLDEHLEQWESFKTK